MKMLSAFSFILILCLAGASHAADEVIKYPPEELPSEVVLPIISRPEAVLNPIVDFNNRFEINLNMGAMMDDPYFNGNYFSGRGFYYLNPFWAVGLEMTSFTRKTSSYSEKFRNTGTQGPDYGLAPSAKESYMMEAKWVPYYGKVSFSKTAVIPQTFFVSLGAGIIKYDKSTANHWNVAAGFGQGFYFAPTWAFTYQLDLWFHSQPDQNSQNLTTNAALGTYNGDFSNKTTSSILLNIGISKLF